MRSLMVGDQGVNLDRVNCFTVQSAGQGEPARFDFEFGMAIG